MAPSSGFKSTHTIKFAKVVKENLDEYHNKITKDEFKIAAAMDPRVKNLLCQMELNTEEIKMLITTEYTSHFLDQYEIMLAQKSNSNASYASQGNAEFNELCGLSGILNKNMPDDELSGSSQTTEPFENELNRWFSHSLMSLTQSSRNVCL